jgi:hypothetical protein
MIKRKSLEFQLEVILAAAANPISDALKNNIELPEDQNGENIMRRK